MQGGQAHGRNESMMDSVFVGSTGRGTTSAEDVQETPTQSHISPSILISEEHLISIRTTLYTKNTEQETMAPMTKTMTQHFRGGITCGLARRGP